MNAARLPGNHVIARRSLQKGSAAAWLESYGVHPAHNNSHFLRITT